VYTVNQTSNIITVQPQGLSRVELHRIFTRRNTCQNMLCQFPMDGDMLDVVSRGE